MAIDALISDIHVTVSVVLDMQKEIMGNQNTTAIPGMASSSFSEFCIE